MLKNLLISLIINTSRRSLSYYETVSFMEIILFIDFLAFRYTKDPQKPSIEKIVMRRDELARFLIDKPREVDSLINDFEMNTEFKQAGLLGIDGKLRFFFQLTKIFIKFI